MVAEFHHLPVLRTSEKQGFLPRIKMAQSVPPEKLGRLHDGNNSCECDAGEQPGNGMAPPAGNPGTLSEGDHNESQGRQFRRITCVIRASGF